MANKKGTLHALIANVAASKGQTEQILGESQKTFKQAHLFDALSRTYRPTHEDEKGQPAEHTILTTTVGEKLDYMAKMVAPTIDILFQVDKTNMEATGDIEIEGLEIKDVPVTFLMQFDKYVTKMRNVILAIPTLNKDYRWEPSNEGAGIWATPVMEKLRTKKVLCHKEMSPATKEFPAQIEKWHEDMPVGLWEEVVTTGRITSAEKHEILYRIDALQKAARKAIAQANTTEHNKDKVGRKIFNYLIGNIPVKRG
jgi:hypothetical protein